jgi:hypothetical protein
MIVHHEGKDATRGARGHSSLRAAVDTEISLKADGQFKTAKVEKQRDGETGVQFAYTLQPVQLGVDEDGEAITSCIVNVTDVPLANRRARLKGNAEVMYQALSDALRDHGEIIQGRDTYPSNRKIVEMAQWRREAERRGVEAGKSSESWRRAFSRAADQLQAQDYIRILDDRVWLIDAE